MRNGEMSERAADVVGTDAGRAVRTEPRTGSRLNALDGLRAVAITVVVLYHLHVPGFKTGFLGVNVFFVLSGFLITGLLLREHDRTGTIRLGRFWGRRWLRLYPALLAVVIVGVLCWPIVGDYQGAEKLNSSQAAAIALSYTGNLFRAFWDTSQGVFAPMWSLSMEEQFYLVWPILLLGVLVIRMRRSVLLAALSALVVASAAAGWMLYRYPKPGSTPDIYFSPVINVAPLLTGAIVAVLLRSDRVRALARGLCGSWATYIGAAGLVGAAGGAAVIGHWADHPASFGLLLPGVGVAAGLLILGLSERRTALSRMLSVSPMAWFGRRVSYSFYLWHVLIIVLLQPFAPSGIVGDLALFVIAAAIATAAAYLIEVPVERLRHRHGATAATKIAEAHERTEKETALGVSVDDRPLVGAPMLTAIR
jgi:peptidoglycan/LPS O-acetylase OafA/YrhL